MGVLVKQKPEQGSRVKNKRVTPFYSLREFATGTLRATAGRYDDAARSGLGYGESATDMSQHPRADIDTTVSSPSETFSPHTVLDSAVQL